jgi:hypothetical protein
MFCCFFMLQACLLQPARHEVHAGNDFGPYGTATLEGGGHSPRYMSTPPPRAEVFLDVSGGSDCTSVFSMDEIHSLYKSVISGYVMIQYTASCRTLH